MFWAEGQTLSKISEAGRSPPPPHLVAENEGEGLLQRAQTLQGLVDHILQIYLKGNGK